MAFLDYQVEYQWMAKRPATVVCVSFPHHPLPLPIRWPALLDTGSPFTILPGKCPKNGLFWPDEKVEVILHVYDEARKKQDVPIILPVRGVPEPIKGFNGPTSWYLPFCARLIVPGFVEGFVEGFVDHDYTVYFEEIDHVGVIALRASRCRLTNRWAACEFDSPPLPP
jgi:hypothetical protein